MARQMLTPVNGRRGLSQDQRFYVRIYKEVGSEMSIQVTPRYEEREDELGYFATSRISIHAPAWGATVY